MNTLGTKAGSSTGLFAPKPLFWERPAFVIWTAAQPDPAKAEQAWADADNAYKGLKLKYDRSRDTGTRTGAFPARTSLFVPFYACPQILLSISCRHTCSPTKCHKDGAVLQIMKWTSLISSRASRGWARSSTQIITWWTRRSMSLGCDMMGWPWGVCGAMTGYGTHRAEGNVEPKL